MTGLIGAALMTATSFFGFLLFFLGPIYGGVVAEAVLRAAGRKRGRILEVIGVGSIALGALLTLGFPLILRLISAAHGPPAASPPAPISSDLCRHGLLTICVASYRLWPGNLCLLRSPEVPVDFLSHCACSEQRDKTRHAWVAIHALVTLLPAATTGAAAVIFILVVLILKMLIVHVVQRAGRSRCTWISLRPGTQSPESLRARRKASRTKRYRHRSGQAVLLPY